MLLPSLASWIMSFWISVLVPTSMPRVGSSRIRKLGSVASHRARMAFCWLPPESCLMGVSRLAVLIWSRSMYRSAISSCLARGSCLNTPRLACSARMMFSRTTGRR